MQETVHHFAQEVSLTDEELFQLINIFHTTRNALNNKETYKEIPT